MSTSRFFSLLFLTSFTVSVLSYCISLISKTYQTYNNVTWWSLGIFVPLSIGMFLAGQLAAKSTNQYLFSNLIMPFTFIKMLFAMVGLVVYKKTYHPETKYFLLPFFLVYMVFTIFETFFMVKLANSKR